MNRKAISAGLFVAMAAVGCGQKTDIVFNIAKKPATADGRTVIEIKPNGKPRPAGVGPGGNYLLLVRKNGEAFYARQFDATEAASGVVRDLAMPHGIAATDKLTVAVENSADPNGSAGVLLSNVLDVPVPPKNAKSFAVPNPKTGKR